MKRTLTIVASAALMLAASIPAFAGGQYCQGHASAASASNACSDAHASAWAGAWLQRSSSGQFTVADVAKGSPAARSGLRPGDVVLAVNGNELCSAEGRAMCSKGQCSVGSTVSYKVQRGHSTKTLKFKLAKMPMDATARYAHQQASFDRGLAAVVFPAAD